VYTPVSVDHFVETLERSLEKIILMMMTALQEFYAKALTVLEFNVVIGNDFRIRII
jgi:hypothetical protein